MFRTLIDPGANHGVGVAFTDRHGGVSALPWGSLNVGRTDCDDPDAVVENFRRVREALGLSAVVTVNQVHGAAVHHVDADVLGTWRPGAEVGSARSGQRSLAVADALVTNERGVGLCIRVADCVPVLLADAEAGMIGAAHAGRVGLVGGVVEATVHAMRERGATRITAWVGPSVCGRCYEVPAQMRADVAAQIPEAWAVSAAGTAALDLRAGALAVLDRARCTAIDVSACTVESDDLHSHRRDGDDAGRLAAICWLA